MGNGTPSDVQYLRWPMSPADMVPEVLTPLRALFLDQQGIDTYGSSLDWFNGNFQTNGPLINIPNTAARPQQFFRVRPSIAPPTTALVFATDSNGQVLRHSVTPTNTGGNLNLETFMVPGVGPVPLTNTVLGPNVQNFMAEWGGWFPNGIPMFAVQGVDASAIREANFSGYGWSQIPLAGPVPPGDGTGALFAWPRSWCPAFHPVTGAVCIFKVDEFVAKVAKRAPGAAVPGSNGGATVKYKYSAAQLGPLVLALAATNTANPVVFGQTITDLVRATE